MVRGSNFEEKNTCDFSDPSLHWKFIYCHFITYPSFLAVIGASIKNIIYQVNSYSLYT